VGGVEKPPAALFLFGLTGVPGLLAVAGRMEDLATLAFLHLVLVLGLAVAPGHLAAKAGEGAGGAASAVVLGVVLSVLAVSVGAVAFRDSTEGWGLLYAILFAVAQLVTLGPAVLVARSFARAPASAMPPT
jgi:hypothetical protein